MTDLNENINEHVEKTVQEILVECKTEEFSIIVQIIREHQVNKYRVQRRLKRIGSRTSRKPTNYKFLET